MCVGSLLFDLFDLFVATPFPRMIGFLGCMGFVDKGDGHVEVAAALICRALSNNQQRLVLRPRIVATENIFVHRLEVLGDLLQIGQHFLVDVIAEPVKSGLRLREKWPCLSGRRSRGNSSEGLKMALAPQAKMEPSGY